MIRLNIHEAKTHLSRYLARLEEGERILLCKRNIPIAEIRPLAREPRHPGPAGHWAGKFEVSEAFFEPLPDDIRSALEEGESGE